VETIHRSRPRPPRDDDPFENDINTPAANNREERALETIRRQLDIDFPLGAEAPLAVQRAPARRPTPKLPARRPRRRMRLGAALGGLFLAACAAVGGAAVGYAIQYVRTAESRATTNRVAPAGPETLAHGVAGSHYTAGPTLDHISPTPPAPASAPEIVLPPRRPSREVSGALAGPKPAPSPATRRATAFFYSGQYFKRLDGGWLVSDEKEGPWVRVADDKVPPALLGLPGAADVGAVQPSNNITSP
jgi:hypothetical protein